MPMTTTGKIIRRLLRDAVTICILSRIRFAVAIADAAQRFKMPRDAELRERRRGPVAISRSVSARRSRQR